MSLGGLLSLGLMVASSPTGGAASIADLLSGVRACERFVDSDGSPAVLTDEGWVSLADVAAADGDSLAFKHAENPALAMVASKVGPTGARCAVSAGIRSERAVRELYRRLIDDRTDTIFAQDQLQSYIVAGDNVIALAMIGTNDQPAIRIAVAKHGNTR